jgi:hypothetical protein
MARKSASLSAPTRRLKRRAGTCPNAQSHARHDRIESYQKTDRHSAWPVHQPTAKENFMLAISPDPILAAIADHRRLWEEYCAAINDVEEAARVSTQTPLFERQLDAMIAERDRLDKTEKKALAALSKVRPTTASGAAALVTYIREDMKTGGSDWHQSALGNVARSLTAMPRA